MPTIEEQYRQLERELSALIGPVRFSADINLRLERMTHLLALIGDPHRALHAIHVGGTAGKGSTATLAAAILTAAGYKTGLHVSPHLQLLNERHQIDGRLAPTSRLLPLFYDMKPAIDEVAASNPFGRPSYFEVQVALAFLLFARERVDAAVIEVGLGGTLDATNVLPARVAVLTNVGLDHTQILGDTVEQIARDKAGIFKPGQTVITGVQQPSVQAIVAERCAAVGATLWQLGREIRLLPGEDDRFTIELPKGAGNRRLTDLALQTIGAFQRENAALAVAAVQALPDLAIPEMAVRQALAETAVPGRMEVVQERPLVILDGAHNPDKIAAAARAIKPLAAGRRRIGLLALKSDKAAAEVLAVVLAAVDSLVLTAFRVKGLWEPYDPAELARLARELAPDRPLQVVPDPDEAVGAALALAAPGDLVWITGSLYLVGDVRDRWFPPARLLAAAEEAAAQPAVP